MEEDISEDLGHRDDDEDTEEILEVVEEEQRETTIMMGFQVMVLIMEMRKEIQHGMEEILTQTQHSGFRTVQKTDHLVILEGQRHDR